MQKMNATADNLAKINSSSFSRIAESPQKANSTNATNGAAPAKSLTPTNVTSNAASTSAKTVKGTSILAEEGSEIIESPMTASWLHPAPRRLAPALLSKPKRETRLEHHPALGPGGVASSVEAASQTLQALGLLATAPPTVQVKAATSSDGKSWHSAVMPEQRSSETAGNAILSLLRTGRGITERQDQDHPALWTERSQHSMLRTREKSDMVPAEVQSLIPASISGEPLTGTAADSSPGAEQDLEELLKEY